MADLGQTAVDVAERRSGEFDSSKGGGVLHTIHVKGKNNTGALKRKKN